MSLRRGYILHIFFVLTGFLLVIRLFYIQVLQHNYRQAADRNIVQSTWDLPHRGILCDREGKLLAYNEPTYDLMVLPQEVNTLNVHKLCKSLGMSASSFEIKMQKARRYSRIKPSVFFKGISQQAWLRFQDDLIDYPGFFVRVRTVRHYPVPILATTLGYLSQASALSSGASSLPQRSEGDLVGASGLEKQYEDLLKGQPGMCYRVVDAKGSDQGAFMAGKLDQAAVSGQDVRLTISAALQQYAELLMQGQRGSVVAIEPATGEVLALASSPSYDPNALSGREMGERFTQLRKDPCFPLFHRAIMATYAPGSTFKPIQALVALQEGVLRPEDLYPCRVTTVKCRRHPSPLNLTVALKHSCNPYFCRVFRNLINRHVAEDVYEDTRVGLARWGSYLLKMGLGKPLGIDIPGERGGCVPTAELYDKRYHKNRWQISTIRSLDIGQGELLMTPLQMGNIAALIANRGYYYTPHLLQSTSLGTELTAEKNDCGIALKHFEAVIEGMRASVVTGTSRRAHIKDIEVCAKTGTVQNAHGADHATCIAFAPKLRPTIAVAVCVENSGWGSRAGAAIAGLVIEKYLKKNVERHAMEAYVLQGKFL